MGNPARDLAGILEDLQRLTAHGIYHDRSGVAPGDLDFWRRQARAVRLLTEVEEMLNAWATEGRPIEQHTPTLVAAYRGIFAPDVQWINGGDAELTPDWAINHLAALADTIDALPTFRQVLVSKASRGTIGDVLDDLGQLLAEHDLALDASSAAYLARLIQSIRSLVDDADKWGDVDLLRHVYELIGVLLTFANIAEQHDQPSGPIAKLRQLAARLIPVAEPVGFTLGLIADGDTVAKMITGG